jgi:hypothetical protein
MVIVVAQWCFESINTYRSKVTHTAKKSVGKRACFWKDWVFCFSQHPYLRNFFTMTVRSSAVQDARPSPNVTSSKSTKTEKRKPEHWSSLSFPVAAVIKKRVILKWILYKFFGAQILIGLNRLKVWTSRRLLFKRWWPFECKIWIATAFSKEAI